LTLPLNQKARSGAKAATARQRILAFIEIFKNESNPHPKAVTSTVGKLLEPLHGGGFATIRRRDHSTAEEVEDGEPSAFDDLMRWFIRICARWRGLHSPRAQPDVLQGTALVHELYMRLLNQKNGWRDRVISMPSPPR